MIETNNILKLENISIEVEEKEIIKNFNLTIKKGETHVLMGPNGSGKSTIAYSIMGHPRYKITSGKIFLQDSDITDMKVEERAKKGLFLAFQYPISIPGVSVKNFLHTSVKNIKGDVPIREFLKILNEKIGTFKMDESIITRYVNDGFSGGEKKRFEILHMSMINPVLSILDEFDSGLDVDSLKTTCLNIKKLQDSERGILLITHYKRVLDYIEPNFVHILINGEIIQSGDKNITNQLEQFGYDYFKNLNVGVSQ
jgi:Fe-S cluster assembly ATP-binding protein